MTTQVVINDDGSVLQSVWPETNTGWKLQHADFF